MEIKLHKNARTTPKIREMIKNSEKSSIELSKELGIHYNTVLKWRKRETPYDRSHTRHNLNISLTPLEEEIVIFLRKEVQLHLDDIVYVINQCVNPDLSRSSIYRCLKRQGISKLKDCISEDRIIPDRQSFKSSDNKCGFIHIDVKHLFYAQNQKAFLAIDRATRYVYVEIRDRLTSKEGSEFLNNFISKFPHKVSIILTDNGKEFTDRFANFKNIKKERPDTPSGNHPFDVLCKVNEIEHRLIKPGKPQTNGMVERFNKRVSEWMKGKQGKFKLKNELELYLYNLTDNYNNTKLKILDYQSPLQVLVNLCNHTEHNTFKHRWMVRNCFSK